MLLTLLLVWSLYPCRMSIVNCLLWGETRGQLRENDLPAQDLTWQRWYFTSCSSWSPGSVDLSTLPHHCPPLWLELGGNGPLQEPFRMLGLGWWQWECLHYRPQDAAFVGGVMHKFLVIKHGRHLRLSGPYFPFEEMKNGHKSNNNKW